MEKKHIYINGSSCISPQATYDNANWNLDRTFNEIRLQCNEPDYSVLPSGMIGRRMGKLTKMGIYTAYHTLQEANVEQPDAILTATGLGCMVETEKFLLSLLENNEQMLNPTAFMQSTHNTLGGQIALMLHCKCYNMTYVHKGFAFESALLDGMMKIEEGQAATALVGGFDEVTERHFTITGRLDHWKKQAIASDKLYEAGHEGTIAGEGATFFLLSDKKNENTASFIDGLDMFFNPSIEEVKERVTSFLDQHELDENDIDLLISGRSGDVVLDRSFNEAERLMPSTAKAYFKHLCGDHHTSAAFALWLSNRIIHDQKIPAAMMPKNTEQRKKINNILIYNHYRNTDHSLYLIKNCRNSG